MFKEHNYSFKVTQDLFASRCGKNIQTLSWKEKFLYSQVLRNREEQHATQGHTGKHQVMRKGVRGKHGPKT